MTHRQHKKNQYVFFQLTYSDNCTLNGSSTGLKRSNSTPVNTNININLMYKAVRKSDYHHGHVDQCSCGPTRKNHRIYLSWSVSYFLSVVFQESGFLTCSDPEIMSKHRVFNIWTGSFDIEIATSVHSLRGIRTHGMKTNRPMTSYWHTLR